MDACNCSVRFWNKQISDGLVLSDKVDATVTLAEILSDFFSCNAGRMRWDVVTTEEAFEMELSWIFFSSIGFQFLLNLYKI